ncbi:unnamed protein product [Oppiella nova]|uniref:alpha-glucosidase n=1 Tax=Oppiella nova TaxID=334625 RepID=A0A7R9QHN8_9ACAR|nr:unnamed protein product [Oppiella nova]CAG2165215.1 unnamed protein product [Oppiella nova]
MASELHLSESIPFGQNSRFAKGVSFQTLTDISDECCLQNRVNIIQRNPMVINTGTSTVISKSSSSDSDTNDSHTRLLEDSLQDFRSVQYLLLTPTATHTTTCLSEDPSNTSDALWTQMQNSLSKEIRTRYLTKRRFGSGIRRDYTLVGLQCYSSAFKTVFSVTLCVLLCCIILLMTVLYVWHNNHFSAHNTVPHIPDQNWWRGSTFYEIFVPSFKDSDGDGFGDLNGLRDKISYLQELGINAIRLNSIFSALDYPHRYDNILDFFSVDPHLGKMSHFIELVKVLHELKMYIILDINLVTTSDQHPWAAHWLLNRSTEYQYFYVNVSEDQINDEDWTSSSATDRLQTDFLHKNTHFGGRLHLNWSHPGVRHQMYEVFDFWLQYIDGFYLKHLEQMYVESETTVYDILRELRNRANKAVMSDPGDEDWTSSSATDRLQTDFLHKNTHFGGRLHLNWSHPGVRHQMYEVFDFWLQYIDGFYLKHLEQMYVESETTVYDILSELRNRANKAVMSDPGVGVGAHKILICSTSFVQKRHKLVLNYMRDPLAPNDLRLSTTATNGSKLIDINSYFDLIDFQLNIDINKTETIRDQVNAIFLNSPNTPWIHWSVGDVERSRLATRIGSQYTMTVSFLLIMLPGTISWFYGDEIALHDTYDPLSQKEYRGGQLCPMQWMSNLNANFSQSNTTKPWLPIHPNYIEINVLKQNESIKRFNELMAFRADHFEVEDMGKHGNYLFHYIDDNQIVFERYFDRGDPPDIRFRYVLFANFGPKPKVRDFSDKFHLSRIKISSYKKREKEFLYMRSLRLDAGEALIVEVD